MSIEIDGFTSSKLKNNNFEKSLYLTKLPTKEWLINQKIIFKDDHIYVLISELFKRNIKMITLWNIILVKNYYIITFQM